MQNRKGKIIDIEKIVPCRWRTGIRNQEKFELLKTNIKTIGLNNPIIVRPIGNGKYEVIIGDHRFLVVKQLGWKQVPCIIEEMTDKQALEKCLSDNINRSNYSPIEQENWAYKLKQSGNYKSNEEIGNVLGFTKQRIGQLLSAKEDRDKFNEMLDENSKLSLLSTNVILDSRHMIEENERLQLLKNVQDGKIKPTNVKEVAKTLQFWDKDLRNKVLYEGYSYYDVRAEQRQLSVKSMKKKETKTIKISDPRFTETLYEQLTNGLRSYLSTIPIGGEPRQRSINYAKFCIALLMEELSRLKIIKYDDYVLVRDKMLKIYRDDLYGYGGEPLDTNIKKWT